MSEIFTPVHLALLISAPGGLTVLLTHSNVAYSSFVGMDRRSFFDTVSGFITFPVTFIVQESKFNCGAIALMSTR
jgi:hypothetical protein